jgi:hypothetical protein
MNTLNATRVGLSTSILLFIGCAKEPVSAPSEARPSLVVSSMTRLDDAEWSEPVWLGPLINSSARDFPGSLSPDGLSLYFQSARADGLGGDDIWVSHRDCLTCQWKAPENLGDVINTSAFDGSPELSRDGCLLFFSSEGHGALGSDIFVSHRAYTGDDFGWREPVNLGPNVNTAAHENNASFLQLGNGNSELYYITDMRGSGNEIFVAAMTRNGKVRGPGVPVDVLNDPDVPDQGPSIRGDGKELLFWGPPGTTRPGGLGLVDIWVSTRRSLHDHWSAPRNLGAPVNSAFADLEPALTPDGHTLIFSSATGRDGLGLGGNDMWMSTRKRANEEIFAEKEHVRKHGHRCPLMRDDSDSHDGA